MGRGQEMGNWSGSSYNTPEVRQQKQTSRVEWKRLGKKKHERSGSEIKLIWVPAPSTSSVILGV